MRTQMVTKTSEDLTVEAMVDALGIEHNELYLMQVICTNKRDHLGIFFVYVEIEGIEEALRVAGVERTQSVVLDDTGERPALLFLDDTTLVACTVKG